MNFIKALIPLLFFIGIDIYAWQTVKTAFVPNSMLTRKMIAWVYWSLTIALYLIFFSGFIWDWRKQPQWFQVIFLGTAVTFFFVKITLVFFSAVDDVIRLFKLGYYGIAKGKIAGNHITRSTFLARLALVIAIIPFYSYIKGIVWDVFNFQYRHKKIKIENLPAEIKGLKIVQLSDIHAGSVYKPNVLLEVVKRVNDWQPDLILFTGDLVNDTADEAEAVIPILKELKARLGVWSTTGNHDYGDYIEWNSAEEKANNFKKLMLAHERMGWNLMMNTNKIFEFGKSTLALIGIENWGGSLHFPKYGKMDVAYKGAENADVKILLSHDPSHWDAQVRKEYGNIDLTLSGHTHGLQMGIENKYFKWSPSQYIYKQWADLYRVGKQQIYVNRGIGFLGYPGRVGILPEIAFIELV